MSQLGEAANNALAQADVPVAVVSILLGMCLGVLAVRAMCVARRHAAARRNHAVRMQLEREWEDRSLMSSVG